MQLASCARHFLRTMINMLLEWGIHIVVSYILITLNTTCFYQLPVTCPLHAKWHIHCEDSTLCLHTALLMALTHTSSHLLHPPACFSFSMAHLHAVFGLLHFRGPQHGCQAIRQLTCFYQQMLFAVIWCANSMHAPGECDSTIYGYQYYILEVFT